MRHKQVQFHFEIELTKPIQTYEIVIFVLFQNLIDKVELHATGAGNNSKLSQSALTAIPGPSWSNGIHSQSSSEPSRKSRVFNIRQRLRELYLEECRNAQPFSSVPLKNLKRGSRLLEKLVQRENLNTLIVNLYPGNKGYSLSLRLQGKVPAGELACQ